MNTIGAALLSTTFALALGATAVAQTAVGSGAGAPGDTQIVTRSDSHSLALQVKDGKVTAKLDGKEVPADRIKVDGGRVTILDADGAPLEDFDISIGDGGARVRVGDILGETGLELPFDVDDLLFEDGGMGMNFRFGEPLPVMIGISMSEPGPALVKHLRLPKDGTAMITGVYEGLPAHRAGLGQYDIIVGIDGERPASPAVIRKRLRSLEPGDDIRLEVIQEGKKREVRVEVSETDQKRLRESRLLGAGVAGMPQGLNELFVPDVDGGALRDIVVSPDARLFRLQPDMDREMDALRGLIERQRSGGDEELGARLEALNDRMAELESMLERLIDRLGDR